ncbi:hypothetical protein BASA81_010171 [Batrachochytrium salamandrivorans]|nr:hypothetical protein BASA81_010171 [Batrachochytrium salamandrivorans]
MKFGKYLESQVKPEFVGYYVDYERLKKMISALSQVEFKDQLGLEEGATGFGERVMTLSTTPNMPETAKFEGKDLSETDFFNLLESEMKKVDEFTHEKVKEAVARVDELDRKVATAHLDEQTRKALKAEAQAIGDAFLAVEKYANINYLAVHKILKKHDKSLPIPCRRFYITRLHGQRWVKNDYSRLFVRLSQIHSNLRGDSATDANKTDGAQQFVRTTKKYWVRTEDISKVKHMIVQNINIFQHDLEALEGDNQLTNSVYFDNESLELYHGRLDKTPGAIAIRFRWYATEEPNTVFVERKTHREAWTGEISVKERFTLKKDQVMPFLQGKFTVEDMMEEMKRKGKSEKEMDQVRVLFQEIYSQIDSKQLRPCMRTRYNRSAYQAPDSSVRISLDTGMIMMTENPKFPHAILEVKLSLKEGQEQPKWVADLLNSGVATEVHKFSKFIHGCATLLTDSVRAVPYWVDDPSVRPSILRSQPQRVQQRRLGNGGGDTTNGNKGGESDDEGEDQGDVFSGREIQLMKRNASMGSPDVRAQQYGATESSPLVGHGHSHNHGHSHGARGQGWWPSWCIGGRASATSRMERKIPMKVEPKVFLANERTMLSWLHMSVTIGTIAAAMMGLPGRRTSTVGMLLFPVSIVFALYALVTFYWRGKAIAQKHSEIPMHDMFGPTVVALTLVFALSATFVVQLTS